MVISVQMYGIFSIPTKFYIEYFQHKKIKPPKIESHKVTK